MEKDTLIKTKFRLYFIPTNVKHPASNKFLYQVYTDTGIPEIGIKPMTYGGYVENPDNIKNSWIGKDSYILGTSTVTSGAVIEESTIVNTEVMGSSHIKYSIIYKSEIIGYNKITKCIFMERVKVLGLAPGNNKEITTIHECNVTNDVTIKGHNYIHYCDIFSHFSRLYITDSKISNSNINSNNMTSLTNCDIKNYNFLFYANNLDGFSFYNTLNTKYTIKLPTGFNLTAHSFLKFGELMFFKDHKNQNVYFQIGNAENPNESGTWADFDRIYYKTVMWCEYAKHVVMTFKVPQPKTGLVRIIKNYMDRKKIKNELKQYYNYFTY